MKILKRRWNHFYEEQIKEKADVPYEKIWKEQHDKLEPKEPTKSSPFEFRTISRQKAFHNHEFNSNCEERHTMKLRSESAHQTFKTMQDAA